MRLPGDDIQFTAFKCDRCGKCLYDYDVHLQFNQDVNIELDANPILA